MSALENTVNQAISDFDGIQDAIEDMGVSVPQGTNTSEYGNLIRSIPQTGGGVTDVKVDGTSVVTSGVAAIDLTGKVDKVSGKGLSKNDYTDAEKTKLSGIETDAEKNIIEGVQLNGTDLTPDANRKVNVAPSSSDVSDTTYGTVFDGLITLDGNISLKANQSDVDAIEEKIPSAASSSNKLISNSEVPTAVRGVRPLTSTTKPATLAANTIYDLGTQVSLSIVLPASGQLGDFVQVDFLSGSTATTLTISSSAGLSDYDLTPATNSIYSLYFDWGVLYYDTNNSAYVYGWRFGYAEYTKTLGA